MQDPDKMEEVVRTLSQVDQLTKWRDAELHPDLVPFLEDTDVFGQVLKHPLVFAIPLFLPGQANEVYEAKTQAVNDAFENGKWNSYVFLHERPYRFPALHTIMPLMTDEAYWELLASVWIDSENLHQNLSLLEEMMTVDGRDFMMDDEEKTALAEMPDPIVVWRGVNPNGTLRGWSWTVNKERAIWFAQRLSQGGENVLAEGRICKDDVIAYFTGRGEDEIVAHPDTVDIVSITKGIAE